MKNMMVKFGAAALSAAMVFSNGAFLTAGAEEETTTLAAEVTTIATEAATEAATQAATEAATTTTKGTTAAIEAATTTTTTIAATETTTAAATTTQVAVSLSALAGKWDYQVSNGNYTVDKGSKSNGTVEIKADGTFTYTDTANKTVNGTVKIESDGIVGSTVSMVNFYVNGAISFGGAYRSNNEISIGNGGTARLVRNTASATTTTAATTTKAANKNDSPKTGDSFPALAMTAALLSAAALSITTKKRNK
ncbi:MAG: LPXTG cell wall anchor domain-containing protein [Ruminococcus sp.]|nr:LPXTG cell wall anchor domain-containing protein [Ruminococcus sp.]